MNPHVNFERKKERKLMHFIIIIFKVILRWEHRQGTCTHIQNAATFLGYGCGPLNHNHTAYIFSYSSIASKHSCKPSTGSHVSCCNIVTAGTVDSAAAIEKTKSQSSLESPHSTRNQTSPSRWCPHTSSGSPRLRILPSESCTTHGHPPPFCQHIHQPTIITSVPSCVIKQKQGKLQQLARALEEKI